MRPTKRTSAKRIVAKKKPRKYTTKRAYDSKSPLGKLMKLKYRINDSCVGGEFYDAQTHDIEDTILNKTWVTEEIDNLKNGGWLTATKMKVANEMWRKYAGQ